MNIVRDKYYIYLGRKVEQDGFYLAEKPRRVFIKGFENLFAHKLPASMDYGVSEAMSGLSVGRGKTVSEAIQDATRLLTQKGKGEFNKARRTALAKYGLSPRFRLNTPILKDPSIVEWNTVDSSL